MAASGSAAPMTPPKAAAPVAPAYPKWSAPRPAPGAPAPPSAPSAAPTAPKAKAKKRNNRGASQEWREGNRFRAMSELKDQEARNREIEQQNAAAAAQQQVVQTQRDAFHETLQRQKSYYENKVQEYSLSLAANQQLQEDHSKMKQDLTEAKVTYKENLQKQRAYYEKQIQDYNLTLAAHQQLLEDHSKTKQDLQELKEARPRYTTRKSCRSKGLTMKRK